MTASFFVTITMGDAHGLAGSSKILLPSIFLTSSAVSFLGNGRRQVSAVLPVLILCSAKVV